MAPGSKWDAANLEHGTHVAGISAGYAVDGEGAVSFSGVAPDAQVIPMKVFDDSGTGAATTTILAALEDAYRLGVDAVNLSLGSYGAASPWTRTPSSTMCTTSWMPPALWSSLPPATRPPPAI